MAIYDRNGNIVDLIGAVEIERGLWALHMRRANDPTADVELAEAHFLKADNQWHEISTTCSALAASTPPDIAAAIRHDFNAMLKHVSQRKFVVEFKRTDTYRGAVEVEAEDEEAARMKVEDALDDGDRFPWEAFLPDSACDLHDVMSAEDYRNRKPKRPPVRLRGQGITRDR